MQLGHDGEERTLLLAHAVPHSSRLAPMSATTGTAPPGPPFTERSTLSEEVAPSAAPSVVGPSQEGGASGVGSTHVIFNAPREPYDDPRRSSASIAVASAEPFSESDPGTQVISSLPHPTPPHPTQSFPTPPSPTLPHPTPPYSTLPHPTPPYPTLPHPTPPYSTLLHPTPPYSTLPPTLPPTLTPTLTPTPTAAVGRLPAEACSDDDGYCGLPRQFARARHTHTQLGLLRAHGL